MLPTPSRRRLASVLGLLLVLPSSGCLSRHLLTPQVLTVAGGIDWVDPSIPPHSRIVPDTVLFCASGTLEVQANVFPPPNVQWRGRSRSPVRVYYQTRFDRVLPGVRAGEVTYSTEMSEAECGPIAERARLAIEPEYWSVETAPRCWSTDPAIRTLSFLPGETLDLAPELLDLVPVRKLEIAALSDLRPAVATKEPRPAAYALLPLALISDGSGYAVTTAAVAVTYSPYLAAAVLTLPFFPLYGHPPRNPPAASSSVNFEGVNLSARSFANSASLASANLRCASLVAADLRGARLGEADLANTRLLAARLDGADLSKTKNLTQAQLDSACGDARTRVPPGFAPPPLCAAP